jgi:hypothetical protein
MSGGETAVPAVSANGKGSSPEPVTADPLTGFGTRAALLTALRAAVTPDSAAALLVVFGLAGYEEYVSLFGRLAGRSLIVKLGARLADALPAGTTCFRPVKASSRRSSRPRPAESTPFSTTRSAHCGIVRRPWP